MNSKLGKMFSGLKKWWLLLAILILIAPLLSACKEVKVKFMTRNLYLGADIFKVVEAAQDNPASIPFVVAEVFQTMQYTNFPARAEAIAEEIANAKPQVIGLQEVSTYYIQTPGDFMIGNPVQANTVVIDFYTVLDAALKARGMYYDAFTVINAEVEFPMVDPSSLTGLSDVRMVDHDVVLVRKGLPAWEVLASNFSTNLEMNLGVVPVEFTRGFVVVDTIIRGVKFRIVNSHLEVRSEPGSPFRFVQSAQMKELLNTLTELPYPKPTIMVGDFNSSVDDIPGVFIHPDLGPLPYVPPYMQAVDAGYLDTWLMQRRHDEGYTSGFDELVNDPTDELTTRIDLVFLDPLHLWIFKVRCDVVGDEESDMVPNTLDPDSNLWPSDHAGVVAKFRFLTPW